MQIEIAKHERMSERGSSLLRLIQNNEMPILDLLVREAVQNSLDASLTGKGFVKVDFNVGEFNNLTFSDNFEGIRKKLHKKFGEEKQKYIEIRDTHTQGLSGPLHYDDVVDEDYGNMLKLVYEISMPQDKEGAGGSWGLGKTIYFRVGIGLVVYYSRVKINNRYEDRLAACLVENEKSSNSILTYDEGTLKRGIAWWGKAYKNDKTIPITDKNEISRFLKILNIKPFKEEETGTSIIIPFINEKKLLEGILPSNGNDEKSSMWWMYNVSDYIRTALQRWYAPRLNNEAYPYGRWLKALVNGEELIREDIFPVFNIIQDLYNSNPKMKNREIKIKSLSSEQIFIEEIELRKIFKGDSCSGHFIYTNLKKDDLRMLPPDNNLSPYIHINHFDYNREVNTPVVSYTRKPGMIVGYETEGKWIRKKSYANNEDFIIGIFVINSNKELEKTEQNITLEEYIRRSEKADHTNWNDWSIGDYNPHIIRKIQSQINRKLDKKFEDNKIENYKKRKIGLGRMLANELLPPENFGTIASSKHKKNGNKERSKRTSTHSLIIKNKPKYKEKEIELDFEIFSGKKSTNFIFELLLKTESGIINPNKWESSNNVGSRFPIELKELKVYKIKTGKKMRPYEPNITLNNENRISEYEQTFFSIEKTKEYGVDSSVIIEIPEKTGYSIEGSLVIKVNDNKVQAGIHLIENGGNK